MMTDVRLLATPRQGLSNSMEHFELFVVGVVVGGTTVLFGFGGGFVTVPVITVVEA